MSLQRWHGWCHKKMLPFRSVLCTPYNHAWRHFMQNHIRKVYVCLAVICHLRFWQNDQGLLGATAVTRWWNRYRNKSQHRKLSLEKKILPPLQRGFEPMTFRSRVQCSNHWAIPAPQLDFNILQATRHLRMNSKRSFYYTHTMCWKTRLAQKQQHTDRHHKVNQNSKWSKEQSLIDLCETYSKVIQESENMLVLSKVWFDQNMVCSRNQQTWNNEILFLTHYGGNSESITLWQTDKYHKSLSPSKPTNIQRSFFTYWEQPNRSIAFQALKKYHPWFMSFTWFLRWLFSWGSTITSILCMLKQIRLSQQNAHSEAALSWTETRHEFMSIIQTETRREFSQ